MIIDPTIGWESPAGVPEVPGILGGPADGTFAEYVVVPARNALPRPAHLDWTEAAALPLSAVTAYRALFTRGGLRAGEHVLLPGIGGGVATIALAMAKAVGATVSVTSRSEDKLRRARELGADHLVHSGADWARELERPVDLVVDSIGSATSGSCLAVLRPGGRLVTLAPPRARRSPSRCGSCSSGRSACWGRRWGARPSSATCSRWSPSTGSARSSTGSIRWPSPCRARAASRPRRPDSSRP
ncbi:zinc-binding dehydrogenase [Streptomyces sp. NPDC051018]|uniref:zinc-binding dehydrogenase n=1 Tax=Streptomyces sp. NPDC051018 TaxID=3365639 RepID=UPI0037BDD5A3